MGDTHTVRTIGEMLLYPRETKPSAKLWRESLVGGRAGGAE